MSTSKNAGPATAVFVEPAPAVTADPASEEDYWHVHYETRPYYKEGRSFGDYEAAYRYGWESAAEFVAMTFEEAERDHLAGGWLAARGGSPLTWDEIREATRDAWNHARRSRQQ